jgi:hypothetical protein
VAFELRSEGWDTGIEPVHATEIRGQRWVNMISIMPFAFAMFVESDVVYETGVGNPIRTKN